MEHESDADTNYDWWGWNDPQIFCKEAGRVGDRRTSSDIPNYSIVKVGTNSEKSPGDMRKVAVSRTWRWCDKHTRSNNTYYFVFLT